MAANATAMVSPLLIAPPGRESYLPRVKSPVTVGLKHLLRGPRARAYGTLGNQGAPRSGR
jgi:hypothetical protein